MKHTTKPGSAERMSGQEISKAYKQWLDTPEGQRCCDGEAYGVYLENRLEVAFQAGIKAAGERNS